MKMKRISFIIFIIISFCLFVSCNEENIPKEKEIVVVLLDNTFFETKEDVVISGLFYVLNTDDTLTEVVITNTFYKINELKQGLNYITLMYKSIKLEYEIYIFKDEDISKEEALIKYLEYLYSNKVVSEDLNLIKKYQDIDIYFDSSDILVITRNGKVNRQTEDIIVTVEFYFFVEVDMYQVFIPITVLGKGDYLDASIEYLNSNIPTSIRENYTLITNIEKYNCSLRWYLDGVLLEDGVIIVTKQEDDYFLDLTCVFNVFGEEKEKTYRIEVLMLSDSQKAIKVLDMYEKNLESFILDSDYIFDKKDPFYNASLSFKCFSPDILSLNGTFTRPLKDTEIDIVLTVLVNKTTERRMLKIYAKGENYMTTWEKIEGFLNKIHKEEIKTQKFYLYGWEEGYTQVSTQNIGYLPFYINEDVKTTVDLLPDNSPLKPNRTRVSTNYITLHNTGMAHPSATAKGLNDYIHSTDRVASWHYSIDDKEAFQHLKLDEVGWHAGDGSTTYGTTYYNTSYNVWAIGGGNQNSVGIEMCVYAGVDFNLVMRNTAKITADLLIRYSLTPASIRQHYDFAGKDCPQVIRSASRWNEMLELIELEYFAKTQLKDVSFEWVSLNPEVMDNTGKVIKNEGKTIINYLVNVKFNNEVKTFNYTSTLKPI